jgi:AcrR family transcriptional regulator
MALTERRTRRRLALRESILEAARKIVRDESLPALTMRRIAEAIGYSPGSIYAHFASRDALLAALCAEGLTALRAALEAAVSAEREPRSRLTALATAYVRFALEQPDTYRLIFMEDSALTKHVFESLESDDGARAMMLILTPFIELHRLGALERSAEPARLADLFWVAIHGLASLRLACPRFPATDDATLIAMVVASALDGARPQRGR